MAVAVDPMILRPASSLLARLFSLASEHVSWSACGGGNDQQAASARMEVVAMARMIVETEEQAMSLWRTANFLPAAGKFRAAAESLRAAVHLAARTRDSLLPKAIQEHTGA